MACSNSKGQGFPASTWFLFIFILSLFFLHLPCFSHLPSRSRYLLCLWPKCSSHRSHNSFSSFDDCFSQKSFSQKLFSPRYSLASSLHPRFTPVIADPVTRPSLPQCLLPCTDCTCSLFPVVTRNKEHVQNQNNHNHINININIPSYHSAHTSMSYMLPVINNTLFPSFCI